MCDILHCELLCEGRFIKRKGIRNLSSEILIKEVLSKADRKTFVEYPNLLYRDVENFVPAFYGDDMADWDKDKNPAFEYCEARAFLAYRDGEVVGRIGAILSHKANERWGTKRMLRQSRTGPARRA